MPQDRLPDLDLPQRVLGFVADQRLFPEPGRALVAVSGGPDSVALLYLLRDLAPRLGLAVAVAHVDHGIHEASASWAARVAALAERVGVPCAATRLELGPDASETVARQHRYRALRRMQLALGARYLVTAHHADDQVETVLLRVLRGSGAAGLAGIAPTGPGGLVRPLLPFRKAELVAWLRERAPDAVSHLDPANLSPAHDRSWVRTVLLPLVRARFPDVDARMLTLQRQAALDRAAWDRVLESVPALEFRRVPGGIEVARAPMARYDKVLSVALLRALARAAGCRMGLMRAERVRLFAAGASSGRQMPVGDGWLAETSFERLVIHRPQLHSPAAMVGVVGGAGEARFGDWCITWCPEAAGAPRRSDLVTWVTPGPLAVRAMRGGERMRPLGGVGRRSVRRLLMEARVSRRERAGYPLVVRDDGVLWIPGVCRGDAAVPGVGEPALRIAACRAGRPEPDVPSRDR